MADPYRLLRRIGFTLDPERAHRLALRAHRVMGRARRIDPPGEPVRVMDIDFPNVVGLAAGYDKGGEAWRGLAALGFGHLELGTVTPQAQSGNTRPRIFRFPEHEALVNRMGFPSEGADVVAGRLGAARGRGVVIGVSIGPNGFSDEQQAAADYRTLVTRFAPLADYLSVNVSSPNTPGLRSLEVAVSLTPVLEQIALAREAAVEEIGRAVPVVVKLSPDVPEAHLEGVVAVVQRTGMDGIVVTNTTTRRPGGVGEGESGGLSGAPLRPIALEMLERVAALTDLPLIASGGITSAADAQERLTAGASLVQIYTGLVYRGPRLVREIAISS